MSLLSSICRLFAGRCSEDDLDKKRTPPTSQPSVQERNLGQKEAGAENEADNELENLGRDEFGRG